MASVSSTALERFQGMSTEALLDEMEKLTPRVDPESLEHRLVIRGILMCRAMNEPISEEERLALDKSGAGQKLSEKERQDLDALQARLEGKK